jgi:hypothetical protein
MILVIFGFTFPVNETKVIPLFYKWIDAQQE